MTKEEILDQIQITIVDVVENCNDSYVSRGLANNEAMQAFSNVKEYIKEIYRLGVIDGFKSSAEGWNGEYPSISDEEFDEHVNVVVKEIC